MCGFPWVCKYDHGEEGRYGGRRGEENPPAEGDEREWRAERRFEGKQAFWNAI